MSQLVAGLLLLGVSTALLRAQSPDSYRETPVPEATEKESVPTVVFPSALTPRSETNSSQEQSGQSPTPGDLGPQESAPGDQKSELQPEPSKISFLKYARYLMLIEGDKGRGSGFIATYLDKPFLFTNTHVLSGNTQVKARSLSGKEIVVKGVSMAEARDVSLLPQETVPEGMEILKDMDTEVSIGDDVVVLGNSLGSGVVTEIAGKVTGVGPDLVEVDAKFVSGNSGSPIIHVKTGKVIGIATYATLRKMEGFGEDSKFNNVERYFAYRLDNINSWRNVTWPAFAKEAGSVEAIHSNTADMWRLAEDIAKDGKINDWNVHTQRDNAVAVHVSTFQKIANSRGLASKEYLEAKKKLLYWLKIEMKKDFNNFNYAGYTQYHRERINSDKADREIIRQYFDYLEKDLRM